MALAACRYLPPVRSQAECELVAVFAVRVNICGLVYYVRRHDTVIVVAEVRALHRFEWPVAEEVI